MNAVALGERSNLLLDLTSDRQLLYSLPKDKMALVIRRVRGTMNLKYKTNKIPKYRFPGFKAMPQEDLCKFFAAFQPHEFKYKVFFAVQAFLGLRIGEVVKLRLSDFDFERKQVRVRSLKQLSCDVVDLMPLHEMLEQLVLDYLHFYEREILEHDGFLFFAVKNNKAKFISHCHARQVFRRVCKRAGLNEIYGERSDISGSVNFMPGKLYRYSPHSLRHSFGHFVSRKLPLPLVQALMRHRSLQSTQRYTYPTYEETKKEFMQLFAKQQV